MLLFHLVPEAFILTVCYLSFPEVVWGTTDQEPPGFVFSMDSPQMSVLFGLCKVKMYVLEFLL